MIITVNQKNLKNSLSIAEKIVSRNITLPILQNIIIKTENGRLKISSTNLEIGINCWLGAKIEEEGEVAVPARIFSDFINNIQDEKITISSKNNIIDINSENYKTKIIGFSAKDFPIIPKIKEKPLINVSSRELLQIFTTVIDSVSLSEARPELSGVLLSFCQDRIEGAATDSFRLAEKVLSKKVPSFEQNIIIPRSTAQELIRILSVLDEEVSLTVSENQIFLTTPGIEVISRLVDGSYPDYKKVIPEKHVSKILVDKNELEKNVRLASIFSSHISDIKIQGEEEGLRITAKNPDRGEISSWLKGTLKDEPFSLSVNYRYLLDGLKVMPTEKVIIEFTGEGNPLVLRPEERKDIVYLIMPLRS